MFVVAEVEHWMGEGRSNATEPNQTPNAATDRTGVRLRVLRSVVKREIAQTAS